MGQDNQGDEGWSTRPRQRTWRYFLMMLAILLCLLTIVISESATSETDNYWWGPWGELDLENVSEFPATVEFSPTGEEMAFFADGLRIFNVSTNETVLTWEPPYDMTPSFMSWTNDGDLLAWRLKDRIMVLDVLSQEIVAEVHFAENVMFFQFSPDDAYVGVLSVHYIYVVNTTTWDQTVQIEAEDTSVSSVYSLSWNPSGDTFVVLGGLDGYLYETGTWRYLGTLPAFNAGKRGVWTEDGRFIHSVGTSVYEYDPVNETDVRIAGGLDPWYTIPLYDLTSNDVVVHEQYTAPKVLDRSSGSCVQDLGQLPLFANEHVVEHVSLSAGDRFMAMVWSENYRTDEHLTVLGKRVVGFPPSLDEAPDPAFAMLKPYDITFAVPSLVDPDSITSVLLDIGGHTQITWSVEDGSMSASNPDLILEGMAITLGTSPVLVCTLWFNWSFPETEGCNMTLALRLSEGIRLVWEYEDAFDVVTDLELTGQIQAVGEFQGPLGNDSWARANETIEWVLPRVTYRGYPDVDARPEHIEWFLYQDGRMEWSGRPGTDGHARTNTRTPPVDLGGIEVTAVANTVHDNRTLGTSTFRLGVDGTPPEYLELIPESGIWQATTSVLVGARVFEGNGSGLVPESLRMSWRTGAGEWSSWEDVTVNVMDPHTVFGTSTIDLQEGEDNWVRWTCADMVGNQADPGQLAVLVDLTHVRFSDFTPQGWVNEILLTSSVDISDLGGSGVSGPSVKVRWSSEGLPGYGPWVSLDLTGVQQLWSAFYSISLSEGVDNLVQWRAEDVAGTGLTDSEHYQVFIDTSPPTLGEFSPRAIQTSREVPLSVEVSDDGSSGLATGDVQWRLDGGEWRGVDLLADGMARTTLTVPRDGSYNVTFKVRDGAGNTATSGTFAVVVDTSPPGIVQMEPDPGSYIIGTRCTFRVLVQDGTGGVNTSSVMFSLKKGSGSEWSAWLPMKAVTVGEGTVEASTVVELRPDHDNWIRARASDGVGNGPYVTEDIRLPVDMPPTAAIAMPDANGTYFDDTEISFDSSGSGDPEGDISLEWEIDGGWYGTTEPDFRVRLPAGDHVINLVVTDEAGQRDETSTTLKVRTAEEGTGPGLWWLLPVVVVVIFVIVVAVAYRRHLSRNA